MKSEKVIKGKAIGNKPLNHNRITCYKLKFSNNHCGSFLKLFPYFKNSLNSPQIDAGIFKHIHYNGALQLFPSLKKQTETIKKGQQFQKEDIFVFNKQFYVKIRMKRMWSFQIFNRVFISSISSFLSVFQINLELRILSFLMFISSFCQEVVKDF